MLNPSTADGTQDDPTIRKCRGFAERLGFKGFSVCNLYAWRATDPADLSAASLRGEDVIGPENTRYLNDTAGTAKTVICAWGAFNGRHLPARALRVGKSLEQTTNGNLWALGFSKHGDPRHPLMMPYGEQALLVKYKPWDLLNNIPEGKKDTDV